jgi:hypothetical protein
VPPICTGQTAAAGRAWGLGGFAEVVRLRARWIVGRIANAPAAEPQSMAR